MRLERTGGFDLDQRYASLCPNELFNSIKSLKAFSISHLYTRYTPHIIQDVKSVLTSCEVKETTSSNT